MQHANTISRTSCSKPSAKSHPVDTHQSFFQTLVKGCPTAPPPPPPHTLPAARRDSAHTRNSTVVEMYKETAHEHGVWRWSGCCSSRLCYLCGALAVGLHIPDVNLTQHRIAKLQACSKANKATQQPTPTQRNILRNKNWHVSFCDTAGTLMSSSSSISVNRQN